MQTVVEKQWAKARKKQNERLFSPFVWKSMCFKHIVQPACMPNKLGYRKKKGF